MTITVKLRDIVREMDGIPDEMTVYLDRTTGRFHAVFHDVMQAAEEGNPQDWEEEQLEEASEILGNEDNYVPLPSQLDIHEYSIMERFSESIKQAEISGILLKTMRGGGAFRRFKDALRRHDMEDSWRSFKDEALKEIALSWCEENDVEYAP